MKKNLFLFPFLLILAACTAQPQPTPDVADRVNATLTAMAQTALPGPDHIQPTATQSPASDANPEALSLDVLKNAVYTSPDWGQFQLSDGIFYRTPPTTQESRDAYTTRLMDTVLFGDIDRDGEEDAVVFLATQNGGTGTFIEMAVILSSDGSTASVPDLSLGDRVVIESGMIRDGVITLNMRVHGPNDGLCCPSQSTVWTFRLENGRLVKIT